METTEHDNQPARRVVFPIEQPRDVTVQIGERTLLDQQADAERTMWADRLKHIPGKIYELTGPDAGFPTDMAEWSPGQLLYVERLAYELTYLAQSARSIARRRDGAL